MENFKQIKSTFIFVMNLPDELLKEIYLFSEVFDIFINIQFISTNSYSIINSKHFLFELFKLNINSSEELSETKSYKNLFKLYFLFTISNENSLETNLIQIFSLNMNFDNLLRQHFRGIQIHSKIMNCDDEKMLKNLYSPFIGNFFRIMELEKISKDLKFTKIYLEYLDVKEKKKNRFLFSTNQEKFLPIHSASFFGSILLFKLFVELGADPNVPEEFYGQNCLHIASGRGSHEIVEYILTNSLVDANGLDSDGFSPLHVAIQKNDVKAIKLLLKYGADKEVKVKMISPSLMAKNSENQEIRNLFK
jgi:uncharacterized protein